MPATPTIPTCADYARIMPLATGEVAMRGRLSPVLGRRGPWPERTEMLRRALQDHRLGLTKRLVGVDEYSTEFPES